MGAGHPEDGADAQNGLRRIALEIAAVHGVPGLKAGVDAAGMYGGPPRAPLMAVSAEAALSIRAIVEASLA